MVRIIDKGLAKPDDPIYKDGPIVGGKHFSNSLKKRKQNSTPTSSSKGQPNAKSPQKNPVDLIDQLMAKGLTEEEAVRAISDAML